MVHKYLDLLYYVVSLYSKLFQDIKEEVGDRQRKTWLLWIPLLPPEKVELELVNIVIANSDCCFWVGLNMNLSILSSAKLFRG